MYRVLVLKEFQKDVAKAHWVGQNTVSKLVNKAIKNKEFMSELLDKNKSQEKQRIRMGKIIDDINKKDTIIDSTTALNDHLLKEHNIVAKDWVVKDIMKKELGMSYKKIKPISKHANSEQNLVLWQQFALKLIELLSEGKTILNIDETWVGMSDFRRMKWQQAGSTNSVAKLQIQPRISMIVGIDSKGKAYLSLIQSNSNSKIMEIFFHKLVKVLDK